ncbi:MAG: BamA/TamA family outer membrane protein [Elusimicrobia bacterium]|nr:BamA/TamA family outer membrane protein [Elusimicrobiota bacterium]
MPPRAERSPVHGFPTRARWALLLLAAAAAGEPGAPCPHIRFLGGEEPALSEAERRLVCGDPDSEGWKQVPLTQAKYFLKAFLQQQGYHHPRFEPKDAGLEVWIGTRTRISGVEAEGLPPDLRLSRRRGVIGAWLTPSALDELQAWIVKELQSRGRGCPAVRLEADADTGRVRARVDPGPVHELVKIHEASTGQLDPGVFRRFEAFAYGKPLDLRLLNLTASRVVSEDLFLSAFYDLSCSSQALTVTQRVVTAPPRLVTAGVGFDSEDLARARVRWRNSRIGWRASRFEAILSASQRVQSGEAELRWYPRPAARWYLQPRAEGRRENELRYEALFSEASLQPGIDWDNQRMRLSAQVGPALQYVRTLRGQGPADETFLALRARLEATGHLFEYHLREPKTGWRAVFDVQSRRKGAFADFTAHRFELNAQRLWNLGNYDPPVAILGWRTVAGATLADKESEAPGALPAPLRFFMGGDADVRGFDRKELPIGGEGYLTTHYQGLELRAGDVLPGRVQPLVFVDAAMAGRRSGELEREIYWSPGLGVRWGSPVGALRATAARAYTARRDPALLEHRPHWQVFFSWGQEF